MRPYPIIFSDLDGTLLDAQTYSWEAARPALDLIKKRCIPLVICSSKTRAEIESLRKQLDNHDPFVSENGGGIFVPDGYFDFSFTFHKKVANYRVIELGTPYSRLREILLLIAQQTGIHLKGYGDLSSGEIAAQTGLSLEEAERAKQREYDEPFIVPGDHQQRQQILNLIDRHGLSWTKGSRYDHLTGANDKGKAVKILTGLFRRKIGRIITLALGDSPNDFPMLSVVDYPVLVQRPDGSWKDNVTLPGLKRVIGIGPTGWNASVLEFLAQHAPLD